MDEETAPAEVRRALMLRSIENWKRRNGLLPPSFKQQRARVAQSLPTKEIREQLITRGVIQPAKRAYTTADAKSDRERWMQKALAARAR